MTVRFLQYAVVVNRATGTFLEAVYKYPGTFIGTPSANSIAEGVLFLCVAGAWLPRSGAILFRAGTHAARL